MADLAKDPTVRAVCMALGRGIDRSIAAEKLARAERRKQRRSNKRTAHRA